MSAKAKKGAATKPSSADEEKIVHDFLAAVRIGQVLSAAKIVVVWKQFTDLSVSLSNFFSLPTLLTNAVSRTHGGNY
jgi:hypothetical protein